MTPNRQFTKWNLRKLRKATIKGALFISLASVIIAHTGCSSNDINNQVQHEVLTKQEFTKGVITTLEEITKGDFAIADEQVVPTKADSRVIVKYLDGKIDTMNMAQAQKIANADPSNKLAINDKANRGIGGAIWSGVIGYYIGRRLSSSLNPNAYKNEDTYRRISRTTNSQARSSRRTVSATNSNTRSSKPSSFSTTKKTSSTSNYKSSNSKPSNFTTARKTSSSSSYKTSSSKPSRSSRGFFSRSSRSSGG